MDRTAGCIDELLERQRAARLITPAMPQWFIDRMNDPYGEAMDAHQLDGKGVLDGTTFVTSATGGTKGQKAAQFHRIPFDVLWELAEHYGVGAEKYPDDPETHEANWMKGYDYSLNVDAMLRHLALWLGGEDTDEETGSSHLIAVTWHAITLRWFQIHNRGTDTRTK